MCTSITFRGVTEADDYDDRFHAWQSALLFTAILVLHVMFSWSTFFSWLLFLGDIALVFFLTSRAYRDAEILDRYDRTGRMFLPSSILTIRQQVRSTLLWENSVEDTRRRINVYSC